ncbi:Uncharacterised protein [Mycobacterium tuberculosis]|uniref:Uncharacterized protein n=1 Tax=Mycobacterium tuberculosis TaxID=1773 RepID=A0A916LF16_MYCTX|nr:Uncharacterised protein [Mycobacterium tuberculosis]COX88060.1 Uncharacterised protein [Mycobacterium tuberculosis]COY32926.1 Uncharacterised protein [Mycobacterium tuberculosis]COY83618.1 Uncharacterised protein [Mycobacterium tuberculosis]COZ90394.1 Uncharacterised protein [Mycobacterium tuberculosis]
MLVDGRDQAMNASAVPRSGCRTGAHRQLGFQPEHHPLAVGVLRADQRPGLDAVEYQVCLRIDQRAIDPVGHLFCALEPFPVLVWVAGQE